MILHLLLKATTFIAENFPLVSSVNFFTVGADAKIPVYSGDSVLVSPDVHRINLPSDGA